MLTDSSFIEEKDRSISAGMLTLAALSIDHATNMLYSSPLSTCKDGKGMYQRMICLYLYIYAIETCYFTDAQTLAVLGKIQELQQQCCDFKSDGDFTSGGFTTISVGGGGSTSSSSDIATFELEFNVSADQEGLTIISNPRFANVKVSIVRGTYPLPGIVQIDDQPYFLKSFASTDVNFSHPLVLGEYIKITTIPH